MPFFNGGFKVRVTFEVDGNGIFVNLEINVVFRYEQMAGQVIFDN